MSRWVDVLNRLRQAAVPASLVPSQGDAASSIVALLRTHDVVNLHGPAGSGRTYLGWVLARATGASHAGSPARLAFSTPDLTGRPHPVGADLWMGERLTDVVIVDNCPETRLGTRSVVDDARGRGFRRVVLLTRSAVPDHIAKVALLHGEIDGAVVSATLARLGWPPSPCDDGAPSLWDHVWGDPEATAGTSPANLTADSTNTHA